MKLLFENWRKFIAEAEEIDFGPRPSDAPTRYTTADLSPEQFIHMIDTWGELLDERGKVVVDSPAAKIYAALGKPEIAQGRKKLAINYANLKGVMEKEGKGKLPRKYMPVIKKGFVEDLFNRLKKGKLDWKEPFAATGGEYKGKHGAGKSGRIKSPGSRELAAQSIKEASKEDYAQYKARRGAGFSPLEQSKYAEYLPGKNFPSLQDFEAMPDPKKAKSYWLNKGELPGAGPPTDAITPEFTTVPASKLRPSQDRVYADKIGWKLLEYGADFVGKLAPLKDFGLVDPETGASVKSPDWRYRSIAIKGGLLLDGHHKWALAALSGPDTPVPVLHLPHLDLATTINLLRSYGAAQGFAGQAE